MRPLINASIDSGAARRRSKVRRRLVGTAGSADIAQKHEKSAASRSGAGRAEDHRAWPRKR
ncbi:hypothetical protein BSIN_1067 [Burkholderia singularis]|uniref:Uncharacterized protein n=1 Tax=Burkholderia singularis TaxID=1503053 RepID=A0A238HC63_9BURK|nr:hypothetical protein BSIN_1067 [Burkholderia singularis]